MNGKEYPYVRLNWHRKKMREKKRKIERLRLEIKSHQAEVECIQQQLEREKNYGR